MASNRVVASATAGRRPLLLVTAYAHGHSEGFLLHQHFAFPYRTVAVFTFQSRLANMRPMGKVNVVGHRVDVHPGNRLLLRSVFCEFPDLGVINSNSRMTYHAFLFGRIIHGPAVGGNLVAILAFVQKLCVQLVAEWDRLRLRRLRSRRSLLSAQDPDSHD